MVIYSLFSLKVSSSMASSNGYTDEQLNYYRICFVTTDILVEGLREIFKQEWDKLYKSTLGEWKDEPRNGKDFYNKESPQNQERNAHLLATMKNGNSTEWDCTMLFYAILFSDCVGARLSAIIRKNVDDLRKFKNEKFILMPIGTPLSEIEFQNAISQVDIAFQALGLPTVKIQDLKYQITFPTKQLTKVLKEVVNDRKQDVQAKECQRQVLEIREEAPSFCILPPKPSHVIGNRDREEDEIIQQLKELKEYSGNRLSCFFISGNPGSGKSQLAGLVAKRFYDEVIEIPGCSSFVMTLNAASPDSLLQSYASFARHLNYPDYLVTQILKTDGSIENKIDRLQFVIARKIDRYASWLLVVDNVTTMSTVLVRLQHFEAEPWARGQLLITTQDTTSISLQSAIHKHISVSKGMEPADARSLLVNLSGVADSELGTIIAEKLDYQPLALASAAFVVGTIRQDKAFTHFGWKEYLSALEEGNWDNTEDTLVNTNSLYTMAKAVTLAVKFLIRSDRCVKDLFTLLSLCAPQPLNVDIAINYIVNLRKDFDEADRKLVLMTLMRCSLLLVEEQDSGDFIRVHQLVHDAIRIVISESQESQSPNVVIGTITSFLQFIVALPPGNRGMDTMHIVPHVHALSMILPNISDIFQHDNLSRTFLELLEQGATPVDVAKAYYDLAMIHGILGDHDQAKEYQQIALVINVSGLGNTHVSVAMSYFQLASIYKDSGYLAQAKQYQQRARAIVLMKLEQAKRYQQSPYIIQGSIPQSLDVVEKPEENHQDALTTKIGAEHVPVNLALECEDSDEFGQFKQYQQRVSVVELGKLSSENAPEATGYRHLRPRRGPRCCVIS